MDMQIHFSDVWNIYRNTSCGKHAYKQIYLYSWGKEDYLSNSKSLQLQVQVRDNIGSLDPLQLLLHVEYSPRSPVYSIQGSYIGVLPAKLYTWVGYPWHMIVDSLLTSITILCVQ